MARCSPPFVPLALHSPPYLLHPRCLAVPRFSLLGRLFHSAIVHVNVPHLVSNLVTMAPACVARERRLGSSPRMVAELLALTALSQGLDVGWAVFQRQVRDRPYLYFRVGSVGLSSVAFAVQVRKLVYP